MFLISGVQTISVFAVLLSLIPCSIAENSEFSWKTLSKFHHYAKRPAESIYTFGRPTSRQIAYVAEANFSSILSLVSSFEDDSSFHGVSGDFPSSSNAIAIAESYGMKAFALDTSLTMQSFTEVSDLIMRAPKPVLVTCHTGYSATLMSQLHLVRSGATYAGDIYSEGLALGYDYQYDAGAVALIEAVTGVEDEVSNVMAIETTLTGGEQGYLDYYWVHRVGSGDAFFNVGQVLSTHVDAVRTAGYGAVVSFRTDGEPTTTIPGEELGVGVPIPNDEFSDSNGFYNVTAEAEAWAVAGVPFYNLAVTGWSAQVFNSFLPTLQALLATGRPTLTHCTSGYRSSAYVLVFLAQEQGLCSSWVLSEARKVGFSFDQEADASVFTLMAEVLKC